MPLPNANILNKCLRFRWILKRSFSSTFISNSHATTAEAKSNSKDYASTLCLPKTSFPMKANAVERELIYQRLCTDALYNWQRKLKEKVDFVIHDGPPYANGKLHIGHAMNKIIKDIILRRQVQLGNRISFKPGWDCHGLPIEIKAQLNSTSKDPLEIRSLCHKFASETVEYQKKGMKRWGLLADWDGAYKTLEHQYVMNQLRAFAELFKKGYVFRQKRPVFWSPSSRTALAEAELEYAEDFVSPSAYILFPLNIPVNVAEKYGLPLSCKVSAMIWTTTPWTIPANKAIAIHPNVSYAFVRQTNSNSSDIFVIAEDCISKIEELHKGLKFQKVLVVKGSDLCSFQYENIFTKVLQPFIKADYVVTTTGTGLVHTAPGHGQEDYLACLPHNIDAFCPVDEFGKFTTEAGELFSGKDVLTEGNKAVLETLKDFGVLFAQVDFRHKYPLDWRTKKPIIIRATPQWFIDITHIKPKAISALKEVQMIPQSGRTRLENTILSRSEWCISRQRSWGVPIPVFYNKQTGQLLMNDKTLQYTIGKLNEKGIDAWWSAPLSELLHPDYDANLYERGLDTVDVWLDSGVSWTLLKKRDTPFLADLYLEGTDQFRGWYQSSLLTSVALNNKAPFKSVLTHGFVMDQKGRKMSKSLGNIIDPEEVIHGKKETKLKSPAYGADVLRLWVASNEYTKDVHIGSEMIAKTADTLKKWRNTARFMLANLHDFHEKDCVEYQNLQAVDKCIFDSLYQLSQKVREYHDSFQFHKSVRVINELINETLSNFYLDILKDRLYTERHNSLDRRSAQTVLFYTLDHLTRYIAPMVPFLAEDIYQHYRHCFKEESDSIFHRGIQIPPQEWILSTEAKENWNKLLKLRTHVNGLLDIARRDKLIKSAMEVNVVIQHQHVFPYRVTDPMEVAMKEIFNCAKVTLIKRNCELGQEHIELGTRLSKVQLLELSEQESLSLTLYSSMKHKCPRCWIHQSENEGELCLRCHSVVA